MLLNVVLDNLMMITYFFLALRLLVLNVLMNMLDLTCGMAFHLK